MYPVDKLIEEFDNAEGKDKRFLAFALKETEDKKDKKDNVKDAEFEEK